MLDGSPTHTRGAAAPPGFFSSSREANGAAGLGCRRHPLSLCLTAIALLLCVPAVGAVRGEEDAPVATIVVTAEPPAATESRAPTAFATEIPAEPHAEQVETVADALSESVGVQVRRFGGLGAFSTISIRGSSSNQVQLYLDGIPLSRARDETVNLSDLPLDSLDHIEVYRGTVPVGFGSGGIGGVVNLVTKPPSATPTTDVGVSYGSFDTRKVIASHSRRRRRRRPARLRHLPGKPGRLRVPRRQRHTAEPARRPAHQAPKQRLRLRRRPAQSGVHARRRTAHRPDQRDLLQGPGGPGHRQLPVGHAPR